MRNKSVKAYLSYVGGFLTHLVTSTFFLWDNMSVYIASYFRYNGHPHTTLLDIRTLFPLFTLALAAGQIFGIPSGRKWGHKLISCINMLLYCFSFYLSSYSDYGSFIFFAGVLPAWCIGVEYLLPVDNAYFYNPDKKVSFFFVKFISLRVLLLALSYLVLDLDQLDFSISWNISLTLIRSQFNQMDFIHLKQHKMFLMQ